MNTKVMLLAFGCLFMPMLGAAQSWIQFSCPTTTQLVRGLCRSNCDNPKRDYDYTATNTYKDENGNTGNLNWGGGGGEYADYLGACTPLSVNNVVQCLYVPNTAHSATSSQNTVISANPAFTSCKVLNNVLTSGCLFQCTLLQKSS